MPFLTDVTSSVSGGEGVSVCDDVSTKGLY